MSLEPASVVAASICWLARQPGLPEIGELRRAVVQRHQIACAWCDFALPDLMRLIEDGLAQTDAIARFGRLPPKEQRRQVEAAQEQELIA